jgi:hypothetical protein
LHYRVAELFVTTILSAYQNVQRWLPWLILYGTFAVNIILDTWLLAVLFRRGARKQLPWFAFYIAWELLSTSAGLILWVAARHLYTTVYWWMEALRIALMVMAVRESLLHIFEGFKSLLRWSVLAVIVAVILYSAGKAVYAPPVQSNPIVSFVIGAEFTFRWGIAAVAVMSTALMWFVQEPREGREYSVVMGCGFASLAVLAWVLSRSFFGTRFTFFTQYLPDVGYFLAVLWWIKVFLRPVEEFGFKELGIGPEDIAKELRRYRELAERIVRKRS